MPDSAFKEVMVIQIHNTATDRASRNGIWIVEELHFPESAYALQMPQTFLALPINLRAHSGAWCRPVFVL